MSSRRRPNAAGRPGGRHRPKAARDFWGTAPPADDAPAPLRAAEHPTALIQSLGAPPLPNGAVARHYFDAVYERAAALAVALATSAGLAEPDEPV